MNTTKSEIITFFETKYVDIKALPSDLVNLWADIAIGEYEQTIGDLGYIDEEQEFNQKLPRGVIDTLALIVKRCYLERELDRLNKKINIIGKDLSLNGTDNAKKMTYTELEYIKTLIDRKVNEVKESSYA